MIRHCINCQQFVFMILDYTGNVFFQFIFPLPSNQCFPMLNCKNKMEIRLRKCICHFWIFRCSAPLLLLYYFFYKDFRCSAPVIIFCKDANSIQFINFQTAISVSIKDFA